MRDLLILGFGLLVALAALRRPFYGALGWVLFSVMNPHRLAYGFAYDFPFAQLMVVVTALGMVFGKDTRTKKGGLASVMLIVLFGWMLITTYTAFHPVAAQEYLQRTAKSFMMTLVLLLLVNSKRDVIMLVGVLALSLAFYGTKGGIFVMATGGAHMVNGPPDSVMDGNNALGVGLTMCIPLVYFLLSQTSQKWQRMALTGVMALSAIAVLGTYSRGALLAVAAMSIFLWLRSRKSVVLILVIAAFLAVAIPNMPKQWTDRMNTISSHEDDASAMGRIHAWQTATNIAVDRFPLAGGFEWHGQDTSLKYSPAPDSVLVAHSIYFQVLGSQGFIGLGVFLAFWLMVYAQCGWVRKQCKGVPERLWAHQLASMVQVSLVGFAVGGAFLDLAFWDLPYYLFAALAGTQYLIGQEMAAQRQKPAGTHPVAPLQASPLGRTPTVKPGQP